MTVSAYATISARPHMWMAHASGYLSAGILLHAITLLEFFTIFAGAIIFGSHWFAFMFLAVLCLLPIFTQLDARSRFQEYKKIRDQLTRHGPDHRIFRSMAASRCQRDAALAAARRLGFTAHGKAFFYAAGYRWYHLLPDAVCHHPCVLFSTPFWSSTFFVPNYHSRHPLQDRNMAGNHLSKGYIFRINDRCLELHHRVTDANCQY